MGSPALGQQPRGRPELPVPSQKPKLSHPRGHHGVSWVPVVPVQRWSPARHGAYRSPREFWEVFSSLGGGVRRLPPRRWGITCFCGGRWAQWEKTKFISSQLPQNVVRGCPFLEGTAAVPASPGLPGATREAAPECPPTPPHSQSIPEAGSSFGSTCGTKFKLKD